MPRFMPGLPEELLLRGDSTDALPEGVLLEPSLPPPAPEDERWFGTRSMELGSLRVGEARLGMKVTQEIDGIQIDLVHLEGPPTRVRVRPSYPQGVQVGTSYLDWERREAQPGGFEIRLSAEEPEHTLWVRFRPVREAWPSRLPAQRSARIARSGFCVLQGDDPKLRAHSELLRRFCESLSELYQVPCTYRVASGDGPGASGAALEPLTLRFLDAEEITRKLPALIGLAERYALAATR
jgi:hypothetical protein